MMLCSCTACDTVKIYCAPNLVPLNNTFSAVFSAPVRQRPPIRIFKTIDSHNEFVPMVYYNDYRTPSTMCANTGNLGEMDQQSLASYICSLYGASDDDDDMSFYWSDSASGWDDWGADYYSGNYSGMMMYRAESVDVFIYDTNDIAMDWMITYAMDGSCQDQSIALAVKCGATDFCLESGESCATDLDCCQSPDDPMYCQPSWGTCVHTVQSD